MQMNETKVAILGAGPAGLTAAYLLGKKGVPATVFERDPRYVGGISRTENYKGFHFDIGGHRFFSKSKQIEGVWTEVLPHGLLLPPRSSRIHNARQFSSHPLRGAGGLLKPGPL